MKSLLLTLFCFLFLSANATHLRCGHISLRNISGLTYEVSIVVYTNTASSIQFGQGTLDFGDGTAQPTPTTPNTIVPFYPNLGMVSYSVNHTFLSPGNYTIVYWEPNLTGGIVNITNSVETPFYLEASFVLDATTPYTSPTFLAPPIFRFAPGKAFSLSHIAVDPNDYQLRYELASPLDPSLNNFSMPDSLKVNFYNGLVTWDGKFKGLSTVGEFLFAVKVIQYDKNGKRIGDLIRTFQVVLEDIDAEINIDDAVKDINNKVFVDQGKSKTIKVWAEQSANHQVKWQAIYDKNISATNVSFTQYDSSASSKSYRVGALTLSATADVLRDNPYMITLRAESVSNATYRDLSFLFFTKDLELVPPTIVPPTVITAIKNDYFNSVSVYPNPFHSSITIQSQQPDRNFSFDIIDIAGRTLHQSSFYGSEKLDTSMLPVGLYIIRLKSNEAYSYLKVVKE